MITVKRNIFTSGESQKIRKKRVIPLNLEKNKSYLILIHILKDPIFSYKISINPQTQQLSIITLSDDQNSLKIINYLENDTLKLSFSHEQ